MLGPEFNNVTTPGELENYYRAVATGATKQSLLIVGPTSTGKSQIAKNVFNFVFPDQLEYPTEQIKSALYLDGGATPARLFFHAQRHAGRTLFIDDPSPSFLKSADGKKIFKQLFTTTSNKRMITWESHAHFLEKLELSPSFWSTSTVVVVCNQFQIFGEDISAIKARATCVYYNPNLESRLEYARQWVGKQLGGKEILKFVAEQLKKGNIRTIHQRHFYHALGFYSTEKKGIITRNWKDYLLQNCQDDNLDDISTVKQDVSTLLRWVGQNTPCGVFTSALIGRSIRSLKNEERRTAAIQEAIKQDMIHELPAPNRPQGSRVRVPSALYGLGPKPKISVSPRFKVVKRTTKETKETKETRRVKTG